MQLVESSAKPLLSQGEKVLRGLFAEMGTLNQNGRRYPEDIYEQACEELIPKIQERRLLGELDHPIDYDEVRLSNVSHAITECEIIEENGIKKVYGTVELLDTPSGMIAQALVNAGINLGISSRGVGSTRQVRDGVEVTQLKLITYDLVAEPSFQNAILSPEASKGLSDSLNYIESKLPLNESTETKSVRNQIYRIRESLLSKKTDPAKEVDINRAEIESLQGLLESAQATIKSDTESMKKSRKELKRLSHELEESNKRYKNLSRNMFSLQESYNTLKENSLTREEAESLNEEIVSLRKQLAVEKRGMAYSQVSELLEGARTSEEIESRLSSLSSLGKSVSTEDLLTESNMTGINLTRERSKMSFLANIVSKV